MVAVSCASCTTNGLAPMVKAINDKFGIEGLCDDGPRQTATQKVADVLNKDWRGGRCASATSSRPRRRQGRRQGHPRRQGQAHGHGSLPPPRLRRRPTVKLNTATSYDDICAEVRPADGPMTGILGYCDGPRLDRPGDQPRRPSHAGAGIVLSPVCQVRRLVRRWGYSNRVVHPMCHMAAVDAKVAAPPPPRALPPSTRESPALPGTVVERGSTAYRGDGGRGGCCGVSARARGGGKTPLPRRRARPPPVPAVGRRVRIGGRRRRAAKTQRRAGHRAASSIDRSFEQAQASPSPLSATTHGQPKSCSSRGTNQHNKEGHHNKMPLIVKPTPAHPEPPAHKICPPRDALRPQARRRGRGDGPPRPVNARTASATRRATRSRPRAAPTPVSWRR